MGKFGFIIHPLELKDLTRKFPFMEKLPEGLVRKAIEKLPPVKVSEINGIASSYGETKGYFVGVPLLPDQMIGLPLYKVERKIVKACNMAASMGAEIVGLGAFTSVVGDKGISISKKVKVPVTTGNTFTVAVALDAVKEACRIMGRDLRNSQIVIVGANGSIGKACAKVLAREVRFLTLVSRNIEKLEQLAEEILAETGLAVHVSSKLESSLRRADVIIAVSSSADVIIHPEFLKKGAVVCDVARPRDVSIMVAEKRKDVLVIEGGIVEVPGDVNFNFKFGLPQKTCYACMAETMILAMEGRYESYSLGNDLDIEKVFEISRLAKKHGFKLAGLRSFERSLSHEDILRVKREALGSAV